MDNRPIGIFDSGVGGLTSVPHLMKNLPNENIIFFGDTARTPYGSKAPSTIQHFTTQICDFLMGKNVKMIVIACNTISATCLESLKAKYPETPIIDVISPTARNVANECSESDNIGIMATKVTIDSKEYEKKIKEKSSNTMNLFSKACPALVPLIEEDIIDNEIMDLTLKYYLEDFITENRINNLVLGCTHYPLVSSNIKKLYPELKIISSSKEVAKAVEYELEKRDMRGYSTQDNNEFYASDLSDNFIKMIEKILGKDQKELNIKFKNVDI